MHWSSLGAGLERSMARYRYSFVRLMRLDSVDTLVASRARGSVPSWLKQAVWPRDQQDNDHPNTGRTGKQRSR